MILFIIVYTLFFAGLSLAPLLVGDPDVKTASDGVDRGGRSVNEEYESL